MPFFFGKLQRCIKILIMNRNFLEQNFLDRVNFCVYVVYTTKGTNMGKRIDNTSCHCLKIRRSAENVIHFYDNVLASSGLTARQYSLLFAINKLGTCNVRELSEAALLDRSTLARSLKPLLQAGYIEDKKNAGARDSVLVLTEKGEQIYRQAAELWNTAQKQFEQKIGRENVEALEKLLVLLQEL